MAVSIVGPLCRIKRELGQWIDSDLVNQCCQEANHRWRNRKLGPLMNVHLLMLQLLSQVALRGLRHVAQFSASGVSASAQAICQARQNLPLTVWMSLVQRVCAKLVGDSGGPGSSLWNGHRVFLADGMSFLTPDTPQLRKRYGKPSNQRGVSHCSYPTPKLLAMLDLGSGLIARVIALPHSRQERTCLKRLLSHLQTGDLLLADRGFAGFAQVAMMLASGVQCCIRLPRWLSVIGAGKANHLRLGRLAKGDLLVRWTQSNRPAKWMSRRAWNLLPEELILRQINFRIRKPGFRDQWMRLVTTLLDPELYPAEQIIDLYAKRWQVEVYFRDMKRSLGMKQMRSRTVSGVRKEILAFVLLYNLIRHVMGHAAEAMGVAADRISFIDAMRWLLWSDPNERRPGTLVLNRRRTRSPEPRVLKRGRRKYPPMNKPRHQLRESLVRELTRTRA